MVNIRFRADTTNSFFGNFLYSQVLPKENFLVRMKDEIPWEKFTLGMLSAYKGGGEYGPTPYAPDKILRMLLIPYLFNISEREAESVVRFNLLAKYFVGLGVDELSPDNSTLTVFKERLLKAQGQKAWESLFNKIIIFAKRKKLSLANCRLLILPIRPPMLIWKKKNKGKGNRDMAKISPVIQMPVLKPKVLKKDKPGKGKT